MSTTHNNKHASSRWLLGMLLTLTYILLLSAVTGGLIPVVPASAQSTEAPNTTTGSLLGTVVDSNNDTIPNATVVLKKTIGEPLTFVTKDDGSFAFHDVTPGIAYQITVAAEGLAQWSSPVTVEPGQDKTLPEIKLRILAVQRAVTVRYSSGEVAAQQLKAEEQQRVLGFIPNIYVTYEPHPEPLTTKMKFQLAYKDLTHPVFFARTAVWAGVEQAAGLRNYPRNMERIWRPVRDRPRRRRYRRLDRQCCSAVTPTSRPPLFLSRQRYKEVPGAPRHPRCIYL